MNDEVHLDCPCQPDAYTPTHLAEKILTSRSALEGERKQVRVLFADLKGSMELLADRDPAEVRRLLDPVLERLITAVHRCEGTVNQVMGVWAKAVAYSRQSGAKAITRAAYREAVANFEQALEALSRLPAHRDTREQALTLAEELGMRQLQAHCHLGFGRLYNQTGRVEQSRLALSTALDLYRAMGQTLMHQGLATWRAMGVALLLPRDHTIMMSKQR